MYHSSVKTCNNTVNCFDTHVKAAPKADRTLMEVVVMFCNVDPKVFRLLIEQNARFSLGTIVVVLVKITGDALFQW